MISIHLDVLSAAKLRIGFAFDRFDCVYVSFSGGKDSGVLLNLALDEARARGRRLGVMHLDYEAQYTATTDYVDAVLSDLAAAGDVDVYRCCVPFKVTTCTSMSQTFWRPWDPEQRDIWVRPLPADALGAEVFPFLTDGMWDYGFQEGFGPWLRERLKAQRVCCLVGIRAQESLHRWRTIASDRNREGKFEGRAWTTTMSDGVVNGYPIYDWTVDDIWTANARFGWRYNGLYDLMHLAGVPLGKQRVASPFLGAAMESLALYRAVEPAVWGRMVSRVNGVNFTSIYGGTTAMGWGEIRKPKHFTWQQYAEFLLSTLPEETAGNYRAKLATSVRFWREKGGCLSERAIADLRAAGIPIEVGGATAYKTAKVPVRMDYADEVDSTEFSLIPTWKRLCVCILKNDHTCKYMGFSQTKQETARRKAAVDKYMAL